MVNAAAARAELNAVISQLETLMLTQKIEPILLADTIRRVREARRYLEPVT